MTMSEVAGQVDATDLFVLRRVAPDTLFNMDGHGRGAGWAGNVSVDPSHEPWIAEILERGLTRKRSGVPFRAFGPYWTDTAAGVTVDNDVVVFGGSGIADRSDDDIVQAARRAGAAAARVTKEKIDADEAEVRQALQELTGIDSAPLDQMARHVASTTARALSCEFGAVLLNGPPIRLFLADEGWRPAASDEEIIAALLPLMQVAGTDMLVEQDLSESSYPYRPLSFDDGLVARCVVPLGEGARLGLLMVAHAGSAPRGFTQLCQRIARTMADSGEPLIARSLNS